MSKPVDATPAGADQPTKEWWDDPGMPWKHKPTRTDIACLTWMGIFAAFNLAMLPLRGWLLAPQRIHLLVALMGSRSGTAGLGALVRTGQFSHWWWPVLFGTLMSIKFDWIYWWAGKLWGRGMIEVWAGRSERAQRRYASAERWARKLGWVGMLIAYVPIPLPIMAVVFVLAGAEAMPLKKFMLLDAGSCLLWLLGYFALGFGMGEPVADALKLYGKIANYVAIALVVGVVVWSIYSSSRKANR